MTSVLSGMAKMVCTVLDGASERAILLSNDGTVLYMNHAARHFLWSNDDTTSTTTHIMDILVPPEGGESNDGSTGEEKFDWRTVEHSRVVMKDGSKTRNERHIHMKQLLDPSSDDVDDEEKKACYYTAFICSKHEKVREIVDHAFDAVLTIDEWGKICTANTAATKLFGYTEGQLVGQNVSIICGGGHGPKHDMYMKRYMAGRNNSNNDDTDNNPDERNDDEKKKKQPTTIVGKTREVMARKQDGTEFPCELGVQEISDASSGRRYFCGYIRDLTRIKEHELQLQERRALSQAMINASFDSMVEIDQEGTINLVNNAACNMFGYTREEFIGSNISMICGGDHAANHSSYLTRYLETGQRRIVGIKRQVVARRKDGSEFEVELGVQEVTLREPVVELNTDNDDDDDDDISTMTSSTSASGTTSTSGGTSKKKKKKKAFCGYMRDLTQQKKDKRALRKQQQLIHDKFFGAPVKEEDEEIKK